MECDGDRLVDQLLSAMDDDDDDDELIMYNDNDCRPGESLLELANQQQSAVPVQKAKLDEEVCIVTLLIQPDTLCVSLFSGPSMRH